MTFTIWSNGGRHEWLVYENEKVVARSGMIFSSRGKAKTALNKWLEENV